MKIALERSTNKIYDRIVIELARGFEKFGHQCTLIIPENITNLDSLLQVYNDNDFALITNSTGLLSIKRENDFIFELIQPNLIFLHHDAPFSSPDLNIIKEKISAFKRIRCKSIHLTIEQSDLEDFHKIDIPSYLTNHISTLGATLPTKQKLDFSRNIAFLGHVIPSTSAFIQFGDSNDLEFFNSYENRFHNMNHLIKSDFNNLSTNNNFDSLSDYVSYKAQYIQYVNFYTMFFRGKVIESITSQEVDIYGGDPSWLHGQKQSRFLSGNNIRYHAPLFEPNQVCEMFSNTRVNLNITSLQFDSAVINRIADCASAGGFILTDRKKQLNDLTSVADEISFSNTEEMLQKISFHSNPENYQFTNEITNQLSTDLSINCSIEATIEKILNCASHFEN